MSIILMGVHAKAESSRMKKTRFSGENPNQDFVGICNMLEKRLWDKNY